MTKYLYLEMRIERLAMAYVVEILEEVLMNVEERSPPDSQVPLEVGRRQLNVKWNATVVGVDFAPVENLLQYWSSDCWQNHGLSTL